MMTGQRRRCFWCQSLFWRKHSWSRKIVRWSQITATSRKKQNQVSLEYYFIVSSPWIKRESKHYYFPNTNKKWRLQDLTRTGASLSRSRKKKKKKKKNGRRRLDSRFIIFAHNLSSKKSTSQQPLLNRTVLWTIGKILSLIISIVE